MEKKLSYNVVSEISSVSSQIYRIFKNQWDNDRKVYNKIKHIKVEITIAKERVTYYLLSGNEVTPKRGVELLEQFKDFADAMIPYVNESIELNSLKEKADSIIAYIKLGDHEESEWNRLK